MKLAQLVWEDESQEVVSIPQAVWIACNRRVRYAFGFSRHCFNTASGMDCMQLVRNDFAEHSEHSFNTASGMDCMQ